MERTIQIIEGLLQITAEDLTQDAMITYEVGNSRYRSFILKVKELIKLVEADGWVQVRTRGSHRQFKHSTKPGKVTISGKLSTEVPIGTLNSVLKQAILG